MFGMIERGEQLCFTLKSREPIGIARERVGQDFDRDLALQPRIFRAIHLAHAARAEKRDDLISAESSAGGEAHFCTASSQLTTTVSGSVRDCCSNTLTRNRFPSFVTA